MRKLVPLAVLSLLATASGAPSRQEPIALKKGLPKPEGLGRSVIVTNYAKRDPRFKALEVLAEHRKARIVRFKDADVASVRKTLQRAGPEFVAVAVTPETVDVGFHYDVLEMCRDLDDDPMPDFHFGYLSTRDGPDMERLVRGTLEREARAGEPQQAKVVALTGTGSQVLPLDFALHFGHGQAWRVESGMTGEEVGRLDLAKAPVIWSGACFGGVLSRSYHKCAYQLVFMPPSTVDPAQLMSLNWVHAGASAYLAALEADRGEMAMAEWDHFRATACPLGEAIGHQYRLAFTSVYADFTKFPRYVPGNRKRMGFYDVMLRGMVSRLLLGDPALAPLKAPLDAPIHDVRAAYDAEGKRLVVDVEVLRFSGGAHVNYLPASSRGVFDARCYVRVAVPEDAPDLAAEGSAEARNGAETVALTRHHVRHEVWGGRRYLNLQAEAPAGRFRNGTHVRYAIPAR